MRAPSGARAPAIVNKMDIESLKKTIEDVGTKLNPGEDWMPVLILEKPDNSVTFIALVGDCLSDQETKDATAEFMTEIIKKERPETAIFVSTAWSVRIKPKTPEYEDTRNKIASGQIPMPSKHPDREEVVVAVCMDDTSEELLIGEILRLPGSHPEIIEWQKMKSDYAPGSGRFPDAMRKGFNQLKERRETYGNDRTKNG